MMGFSRQSLAVAVAKNTSGILLLQQNEISESESGPCIRCGRCVDVCPMQLNPGPISVMVENGRYEQAERAYVMDCMECGSCAYVCPARRPLVQYFRLAKGEILKLRNAGK